MSWFKGEPSVSPPPEPGDPREYAFFSISLEPPRVAWSDATREHHIKSWRAFREEWKRYEWLCARLGVVPRPYPKEREAKALIDAGVMVNPLDAKPAPTAKPRKAPAKRRATK